jgi:Mrp family chromosome partitioning ATPase
MAAEMLHSPEAAEALAAITELLDPEVVLIDLPPVLAGDDVLAVAGQVDAVLLVTDGTRTRPEEIRACERVLEGRLPLLGVVLNRAEEPAAQQYGYGRS